MPKIQLTLVTLEVIFSVNVPVNEHSHCKYSTGVCLFCLYSVLIGSVVYWYMVFLLTLIRQFCSVGVWLPWCCKTTLSTLVRLSHTPYAARNYAGVRAFLNIVTLFDPPSSLFQQAGIQCRPYSSNAKRLLPQQKLHTFFQPFLGIVPRPHPTGKVFCHIWLLSSLLPIRFAKACMCMDTTKFL